MERLSQYLDYSVRCMCCDLFMVAWLPAVAWLSVHFPAFFDDREKVLVWEGRTASVDPVLSFFCYLSDISMDGMAF